MGHPDLKQTLSTDTNTNFAIIDLHLEKSF